MKMLILIFSIAISAKVDPPNYSFKFEEIAPLMPGEAYPVEETKFGKPKFMKKEGENQVFRVEISKLRYKFPIFIKVQKQKIVDLFVKLPSYFLHDVFHQSLIKRYGKQQKYFTLGTNAVYIWEMPTLKMVYSGSCSITCFPIYLEISYKQGTKGIAPFKTFLNESIQHEF